MSKVDQSAKVGNNQQEMICKIVEILQHASMREVTLTYTMLTHLKGDCAEE